MAVDRNINSIPACYLKMYHNLKKGSPNEPLTYGLTKRQEEDRGNIFVFPSRETQPLNETQYLTGHCHIS